MKEERTTVQGKASMLSRYAATTIALFCLWMLLTSTVFDEYLAGAGPRGAARQEILAGAILSLALAYWGHPYLSKRGLSAFSPKRILCIIFYVPVFFYECVKANLDVAYRVVHPKMPIQPGIVAIRTSLKSDVGKLMLANSITLTPGTLTVDVSEEYLFIHWINVESTDVEEAGRLIGGRFEKYLKVIAE
jgi:multicomponent Na+:H+ antiporter subunit E